MATNPIVRKDVAQVLLQGAKKYTDDKIAEIPAFDVNSIAGSNLTVTSGKLGIAPTYTTGIEGKIATAKSEAVSDAKSYTDGKVAEVINGAPEALDTLKEIAEYLDNDDDTKAGLVQQIAKKANTTDVESKFTDAKSAAVAAQATADAAETAAGEAQELADTANRKALDAYGLAETNKSAITALQSATSDASLKAKYPNLAADLSVYATKTELGDYVKASELEALAMTEAEATALVQSVFGA